MEDLAEEAGGWPHCAGRTLHSKGGAIKRTKPFIPRFLLYVRFLKNVVQASAHFDESNALQYFHDLFLFEHAEQASFAWFGARRAAEVHLGVQYEPELAIKNKNLQERIGIAAYGYLGCGGVSTVQKLLGLPVKPLKSSSKTL